MDGVITFFSSQQVMRAEKLLKKNGFEVMLIPGPREISPNCGTALCFEYEKEKEIRSISPNCGTALCFEYEKEKEIRSILENSKANFEAIHYYPQAKKFSKWIEG